MQKIILFMFEYIVMIFILARLIILWHFKENNSSQSLVFWRQLKMDAACGLTLWLCVLSRPSSKQCLAWVPNSGPFLNKNVRHFIILLQQMPNCKLNPSSASPYACLAVQANRNLILCKLNRKMTQVSCIKCSGLLEASYLGFKMAVNWRCLQDTTAGLKGITHLNEKSVVTIIFKQGVIFSSDIRGLWTVCNFTLRSLHVTYVEAVSIFIVHCSRHLQDEYETNGRNEPITSLAMGVRFGG
jgi:hypothetical protein